MLGRQSQNLSASIKARLKASIHPYPVGTQTAMAYVELKSPNFCGSASVTMGSVQAGRGLPAQGYHV